jgi:7,8-dihydropterin-6-yl-methyl-4-(beta-D-ribofuranosyl)aminobenzene 5'-phosphate synthase
VIVIPEQLIRDADHVEVTVLVDNYVEMLMQAETPVVKRPQFSTKRPLLAEHGLSCLIRVFSSDEEHTVLMDTGITPTTLFHNADMLGIDLDAIEAVVLSHGHFDHTNGLLRFLESSGRTLPLMVHPDVFLERRLHPPGQNPVDLPGLDEAMLTRAGAELHKNTRQSTLASGLILATGEVERTTTFEKGLPFAEAKIGGNWVVDPFHDDQGLVIRIKGKGLVVMSGCAHAGIINTVEYAKKITGTSKVYAVLGGFHLTGAVFDPVIQPTVDAMKNIDPDYIIPLHCTGWKAINRFNEAMPDKCILNTVGTTYRF